MGHIVKTSAGTYRANWRDAAGRQTSKTFRTRKEASTFIAKVATAIAADAYVDPHSGRQAFGPYAERWLASRTTEKTTTARDRSIMHVHVLSRWATTPLGRIGHSAVQEWVGSITARRSPATVRTCHRLLRGVLESAVRDRILASNPADNVQLPTVRQRASDGATITLAALTSQLIPAVPLRYRALVAVAGGTGLRWGETVGLRWDAIDLDLATVDVLRVAVEVAGTVTTKPYPKSRAGRRTVPLPPFVVEHLLAHREVYAAASNGEVFTNTTGGPLRRTLFRSRIWRPSLVEAGLLGTVEPYDEIWRASWEDANGERRTDVALSRRDAVRLVAYKASGGLRFHDLRHSYATWLISQGVPVNDVQRVLGHESASTTLSLYTHQSGRTQEAVRGAFADFLLTSDAARTGEWPTG